LLARGCTDSLTDERVGGASPRKDGPRVTVCVLAWCVGGFVLATAGQASADGTPDAERIATARTLGIEGVTLAEAGKCDEAIDRLVRAEALHHAPSTQERLGECHVMLGHLVLGTEILQQVVREPLASGAPAPFVAAHARAQTLLDRTLPRIGALKVHVDGGRGASLDDLSVRIDGQPIAPAMLDIDRPTDPGAHLIEATAKGRKGATSAVTLAEGAHQVVNLTLVSGSDVAVPPVPPPTPVPPPPLPPATPEPTSTSGGSSRWIGWTLGGVGVAGIAVGGVFGAKTFSDKSTLSNECTGQRCPTTASGDISAAGRDSTIANVAMGAGAALVVGGVVLLLVTPKTQSAVSSPAHVTASVGPGWAGLQGAF
jgi:hypothetical protein